MKNLRVLQTFFQKPLLSLADLKNSGIALEKRMFVSVGGGIGSFCWVDGLRVHAVAQDDIAVISHHRSPYQQFKQYCDRSGLCPQDRLRSDSSARPDNFWGFPGYAVDEWWDNLRTGHWSAAGKVAWQIFSEPLLADFYTPTAGRLYASMEREMGRIGWASMVRQGTALFIRKLDDQRYAVFYRAPTRHFHIIIANVVHLALGHTVKQADYLHTKTTDQVLSGYALQDDFFRCVEETHASVVVVGRGIVAARIIEQLLPKDPQVSRALSFLCCAARSKQTSIAVRSSKPRSPVGGYSHLTGHALRLAAHSWKHCKLHPQPSVVNSPKVGVRLLRHPARSGCVI